MNELRICKSLSQTADAHSSALPMRSDMTKAHLFDYGMHQVDVKKRMSIDVKNPDIYLQTQQTYQLKPALPVRFWLTVELEYTELNVH